MDRKNKELGKKYEKKSEKFRKYFQCSLNKGQKISKRLFFWLRICPKTNENTSYTCKNQFICFRFWKNPQLDNLISKLTNL